MSSKNNYFIASFSPVKDVYKSVSTNSNYSSSSSLVSTASSARPQSQQSQSQTQAQQQQQQQQQNSKSGGDLSSGVPVQRSASFNATCTVPLSVSKTTQVKNSASFSSCSLLTKVAKKSGLTGSLTAHSLLKFSSSSSANSLLQLKQQHQANGISISSNITEALAMAGQNSNPSLSNSSSGYLRHSPSASSSTSLASSTTSTVTAAAAVTNPPSSSATISAALSLSQFSKNSMVDYYV
ncbi:uncharacterized protein LOC129765839 [Toxorhynchites rutilus septentrionalis]|uniref:uncharacterized protein LOC129765839 n=1 Tax=Toxorhynchites rutilus septentrionalis TaxID=329112 RepID=UPI002478CBE6|nr:uncharacterized protein LOC129765839 [Toxorhynchites rutilus septentrionalis]